jgi:hypothetical protein
MRDDAGPPASAPYRPRELTDIRQAFVASGAARCPECDVVMHARPIGGGSFGLGYARRRQWLICPRCRRSAIFDAARGTRT